MLFRKTTEAAPGRRSGGRPGNTNEAQLKELRSKARRRLIGALALVLAAVIIVPPLFDEPPAIDAGEPIVVPAPPAGLAMAPGAGDTPLEGTAPADAGMPASGTPDVTDGAVAGAVSGPGPAAPDTGSAPPAGEPMPADTPEPAAPPAAEAPRDTAPPAAAKTPPPAPPKTGEIRERTDDGSVALALLAGKAPQSTGSAPAKAQGSFILQVAAYTTEADARQRRDGLVESGVTNAYVEKGQSGDKTVYRLRVGPFPTHEAAQAAQTRLRALGYQNGLISGK